MIEFSFDEWARLYKIDPTEFERRRAEVLEQEILKAPVSKRNDLRFLQMQCNVLHETLAPIEATAEMSKMMITKLNEMRAPLTQIRTICEDIANSK